MFSGIVEDLGKVVSIVHEGSNIHFTIESKISSEAYIDQSIAHNGVCLTVVSAAGQKHTVTAVHETLSKTNLGLLKVGDPVNLERSLTPGSRMDGHFVQGHVDTIIDCFAVSEKGGSHLFEFVLPPTSSTLIVDRGSVCLNGVSLTVADKTRNGFKIAVIPYTFEHTNFKNLKAGDKVNVEFDVLGKYIVNYLENLVSDPSLLTNILQSVNKK